MARRCRKAREEKQLRACSDRTDKWIAGITLCSGIGNIKFFKLILQANIFFVYLYWKNKSIKSIMRETKLSNNEIALVLENGMSIIVNIDAVPNIIKMLNNLQTNNAASVTKLTVTPVNKKPKDDVITVYKACMLKEYSNLRPESFPVTEDCIAETLKRFAAGKSKLVISSEGKVFLSLASAERYYGLSSGYLSSLIKACSSKRHFFSDVISKYAFTDFMPTVAKVFTMNCAHLGGYMSIEDAIRRAGGSIAHKLLLTDSVIGKHPSEFTGSNLPDCAALMVFNNTIEYRTAFEYQHRFSNPKNKAIKDFICSASLRAFTYCLPSELTWESIYDYKCYSDLTKSYFDVGAQIKNCFINPIAIQPETRQQCFNEIINYLKGSFYILRQYYHMD